MSDENNQGGDGNTGGANGGSGSGSGSSGGSTGSTPRTFTQDQVNHLVAEERRKHEPRIEELTGQVQTLTNEKGEAEHRVEQGESKLKTADAAALRYKVALKKGLPIELADRLQGDNEDAIKQDADGLAKLVTKDGDDGGGGGAGGQLGGGDRGGETPEAPDFNADIRKAAGRPTS